MEYVNSKKLEAVATFIGETEVEGNCICDNFNEVLEENKINVSCTASNCKSNCPFYSKDNFLNWIKKPTKKLSIREVKRPKERDFSLFLDTKGKSLVNYKEYAEALERYCTDLENRWLLLSVRDVQRFIPIRSMGRQYIYTDQRCFRKLRGG